MNTTEVKVYKITLLVIDTDNVGESGIKETIENTSYPNSCIDPKVKKIESRTVQWHDGHPLNKRDTADAEYERIFADGYKCYCHKCMEGVVENGLPYATMHMILCAICGNKRCPHATDHRLECTKSNEPGQKGSVYE